MQTDEMLRKGKRYSGVFIPENVSGVGHLALSGSDSSLSIIAEGESYSYERDLETIFGKFEDNRRCSLHNCLYLGNERRGSREDGTLKHRYYPNFAVVADRYIEADSRCIKTVRYHFEGLFNFFTGHEMFRSLIVSRDAVARVLEDEFQQRRAIREKHGWGEPEYSRDLGENASLAYCSGDFEICEIPISWGIFRLINLTEWSSGSARGVGFANELAVEIEFAEARHLLDVFEPLRTVHSLFELCLGQRQAYDWIQLELEPRSSTGREEDDLREVAELFWSGCNDRQFGDEKAASVPETLLDPERRLDEFCNVLSRWVSSSDELSDARNRFATGFYDGYGIDRLVSAANMFDILPDNRCPPDSCIAEDLGTAMEECRRILRAIPSGPERDSILSSIGRVRKASLTEKVLHQSQVVVSTLGDKLPELSLPCVEAVKCRNHFVHGAAARFDYRYEFETFAFLTNTLEFVFAVSDLIDLGWDDVHWAAQSSTLTHPFKRYLFSYRDNLGRLKDLTARQ